MNKPIKISDEFFNEEDRRWYATYRCVCGNEFNMRVDRKEQKSCGCMIGGKIKHGYKGTRTYGIWANMVSRCTYERDKDYKNYGGRGINIEDDRWFEFVEFLRDMGEAPEGLTLGRIDNEKGYCKDNCEWQTNMQQQANTRNNVYLTKNGETKHIAQWARDLGIKNGLLYDRYHAGWSDEEILTIN